MRIQEISKLIEYFYTDGCLMPNRFFHTNCGIPDTESYIIELDYTKESSFVREDGKITEIPMFMLCILHANINSLAKTLLFRDSNLVVTCTTGSTATSSVISTGVRNLLFYRQTRIFHNNIFDIYESNPGNKDSIEYYGLPGLLFDKQFNPLVLCSWEVDTSNPLQFSPIAPILRVSPKIFTEDLKASKYIKNKIVPEFLKIHNLGVRFIEYNTTKFKRKPTLIVDDIPIAVRKPNSPSPNFKNEDLKKVLENINFKMENIY